jgi:transcriptional regulator with XRE-family HTH domain
MKKDVVSFYLQLGETIKKCREEKKITQDKLAKYLGLSRVSIANIEKGRQRVQVHTLIEISESLEVPINELVYQENNSILEKKIRKEIKLEDSDSYDNIKELINTIRQKKSSTKP